MSDSVLRELARLAARSGDPSDWIYLAQAAGQRGRLDEAALAIVRAQALGGDVTPLLDALCPSLHSFSLRRVHCPTLRGGTCDLSADGRTLAGFDEGGRLLLVEVDTGHVRVVAEFTGPPPTSLSITPDARWAAVILACREVVIVDLAHGEVRTVLTSEEHLMRAVLTDVPGTLYVSDVRHRGSVAFLRHGLRAWRLSEGGQRTPNPALETVDFADVESRSGAVLERKRHGGDLLVHDGIGRRPRVISASGETQARGSSVKLVAGRVLVLGSSLELIRTSDGASVCGPVILSRTSFPYSAFPAPSGRICAVFRDWADGEIEFHDLRAVAPDWPGPPVMKVGVRGFKEGGVLWAAHGLRCVFPTCGQELLVLDAPWGDALPARPQGEQPRATADPVLAATLPDR